tara:strand:- start:167 stop:910 length:744 start_codon:yes stop_codon:yes gene_type:complete
MIYLNGCSFVKGSELPIPRQHFGRQVANHFGKEFKNRAKIGGSNDRIMRTVPVGVETWQPDLVIVMWTFINRFEYMKNTNWQTVQWQHQYPHRYDLKTKRVLDSSQTTKHPNDTDKQWIIKNGWAKTFTNAHSDLQKSLTNMLMTKHYLESKQVPYLFYLASSANIKPLMYLCDDEYFEATNIQWKSEQFTASYYYRELPFLKGTGFLEMCKSEGLPLGEKGHPLQEGHDLFAKRIIQDIEGLKIYD